LGDPQSHRGTTYAAFFDDNQQGANPVDHASGYAHPAYRQPPIGIIRPPQGAAVLPRQPNDKPTNQSK
jgi:hypothetical protein